MKSIIFTLLICLASGAIMFAQETGVVINGVTWATRNVDAPGTFADTPETIGMHYQWNSIVGWHNEIASDGSSWNNEWNGGGVEIWETDNNPCPAGWRVPTIAELESLGEGEWTTNGRVFGSGSNTIFLPAAGCLQPETGTVSLTNSYGFYWSSEAQSTTFFYYLDFGKDYAERNRWTPAMGNTIRCVKDVTTAINEVAEDAENATVTGYFNVLGRQLKEEPKQGFYIIRYDNGKTKKVIK